MHTNIYNAYICTAHNEASFEILDFFHRTLYCNSNIDKAGLPDYPSLKMFFVVTNL